MRSSVHAQPHLHGTESLSPQGFEAISRWFHGVAGIRLGPDKRHLVEGRLRRLCGTQNINVAVDVWLQHASHSSPEMQTLLDALLTNETHFFREIEHFDWLRQHALKRSELKVWSAACSSGEEAYSIAMVLADVWGMPNASDHAWAVWATDASHTMLHRARRAVYPKEVLSKWPADYARRFALQGTDEFSGHVLMHPGLRKSVGFDDRNLFLDQEPLGPFDVIFLRNMLIYFSEQERLHVVQGVLKSLRPGGHLLTGHAETLSHLGLPICMVQPAVYQWLPAESVR